MLLKTRFSATMLRLHATWPITRISIRTWLRGMRPRKPSRASKGLEENERMTFSSRRSFLKASGAMAAAACVGGERLMGAPLRFPVGLQLYSVRNLLPKDFEGTLHQLAAAGYKEVEAAGYFDKTAADFGNALQKAGLKCVSTHHQLVQLKTQFDQLIEYGQGLGLEI